MDNSVVLRTNGNSSSSDSHPAIDHPLPFSLRALFNTFESFSSSLKNRAIQILGPTVPNQIDQALQQQPSVNDYLVQLRLFFSQGDSQIIEPKTEQDFIGEIKDLQASIKQILIDLKRSFPIYVEGKDLRQEAKNVDGHYTADKLQEIFSGRYERLAHFLNHQFLSKNVSLAISDLCPQSLSIYVIQVEKEELKQVAARVCSDEEEIKQLIEGSEYIKASFKAQDDVVYESCQIIKIFCEHMPTEPLAYLFMETHYEKGTFTRTYKKLLIPPQPLDEVKTEEEYIDHLNSLLSKPLVLESKKAESDFLKEVSGNLSFEEHLTEIEKELHLDEISIFLNRRSLFDLTKDEPLKDLLKEKKIAGLLHRAAFFSYAKICQMFTNPELGIHMQSKINKKNCQIHVGLDLERKITFSAYQVLEIGFFDQKKTSELKMCTRYEKERLRIVVEKG